MRTGFSHIHPYINDVFLRKLYTKNPSVTSGKMALIHIFYLIPVGRDVRNVRSFQSVSRGRCGRVFESCWQCDAISGLSGRVYSSW
jgi:hypothetical protein